MIKSEKILEDAIKEKDAILTELAPLEAEKEKLTKEFTPIEEKLRAVRKQIADIEEKKGLADLGRLIIKLAPSRPSDKKLTAETGHFKTEDEK